MPLFLNPIPWLIFLLLCVYVIRQWVKWFRPREVITPKWRAVIRSAKENRLRNRGSTTLQLEQDAMRFVEFVTDEVEREPKHLIPTE